MSIEPPRTRNIGQTKTIAKRLRANLEALGFLINHGRCLEAVAAGFGFNSYAHMRGDAGAAKPWTILRAADRLIALASSIDLPFADAIRALDAAISIPVKEAAE
ncbi:glyoxalase superfamily protein [Sphingomonas cavernae]|uniref:Glyoxalase-related protein domain-containing protein n=1 Tax=Sphingomonas cavernae TaxID=2320861 RepID=A0A418WP47_9SPHN|nr:glyoxalase superfamily protein [Sphingomonas cavernae]RJF93012.1 hypothetical protein D3876_01090 [Sphingomonas cavernae]